MAAPDPELALLLARVSNDLAEIAQRLGLGAERAPSPGADLTPGQVAGWLRCSEPNARRRMRKSGHAFRRGGRLYIAATDLPRLNTRGGQ